MMEASEGAQDNGSARGIRWKESAETREQLKLQEYGWGVLDTLTAVYEK